MNRSRFFRTFLAVLLCLTMTAPALADVLTLPAGLRVISEEAFFGNTSLDEVVLPDGVTEIEERAFAESTLNKINLPESLAGIAGDAIDQKPGILVDAEKGSYAYDWAVEHRFLAPSDSSSSSFAVFYHNGRSLPNRQIIEYDVSKGSFSLDVNILSTRLMRQAADNGCTAVHFFAYPLLEAPDFSDPAQISGRAGGFVFDDTYDCTLAMQLMLQAYINAPGGSDGAFRTIPAETLARYPYFKIHFGFVYGDDKDPVWDCFGIKTVKTAEPVKVSSVGLDRNTLELKTGQSAALTVTVLPENAADRSVVWSSSDDAVAAVDQDGTVTAVSKGAATITAAAADGSGCSAECSVTVSDIPVESVTLNFENYRLLSGETFRLHASVLPENASDKTVTWRSSNETIASVDQTGLVTAVSEGEAVISASAGGENVQPAECAVTVLPSDALNVRITCSGESASVGQSLTWTAEGSNGTEPYKYRFFLYRDGVRDTGATQAYSANNTYSYTFTKPGTYYVAVTLKDQDGKTADAASAEIIVVLEELKIETVVCDHDTIRTTETATWTAAASGGEQPYQFRFVMKQNDETVDDTGFETADAYSYTFEQEGSYQLEVCVKDGTDNISEARVLPLNIALRPVEITEISADKDSAVTESTITWTVTTAAGRAPLTYDYEVRLDGVSKARTEDSDDNTFTYHTDASGSCVLTVTVKDAAGNRTQQDSAAIVISDKDLTLDAVVSDSEWVRTGDPINWTVTASGGLKPLEYRFDVFIDGKEMDGREFMEDSTFLYPTEVSGEHTVLVWVRDKAGTTAELESAAVHVYDPVSVKAVTADEARIPAGSIVNWTAAVQGGRGTLRYDWKVYQDSILRFTYQTDVNSLSYVPMRTGTYTVNVSVTDEGGDTAEYTGGSVTAVPPAVSSTDDFTIQPLTKFNGINGSFCEIISYREDAGASVVIPEKWTDEDGKVRTVVNIADNAFKDNTHIVSVRIADTVESMGSKVFMNCTNLRSVYGGEKLEAVGERAFYGCTSLMDTFFEPSTKTIEKYAYQKCISIRVFEGWEGLETISTSAFNGLSGLKEIHLKEGLKTIGTSAFGNCTGLTEIRIPDSVEVMHGEAFGGCTNLAEVNFPTSWKTVPGTQPSSPFCNCTSLEQIRIPEGVRAIPAFAFNGVTALKSIIYETNELEEIGSDAFRKCTSLPELSMPDTVMKVGEYAYAECTGLQRIHVSSRVTELNDGVFFKCSSIGTVERGDLPDGLKSIGLYTFGSCKNLTDIVIPDNVETMHGNAFNGCSLLSGVNYPMHWTTVQGDTGPFNNCSLEEIHIPQGIRAIPDYAFAGAGYLYTVVYETTVLEKIGAHAFSKCTSLPGLVMPDTVKTVGEYAFSYCEGLTEIHVSSQLEELASYVFYGCNKIEEIKSGDLPAGLLTIGSNAFGNCKDLTSIVIPDGVETIYGEAFANCKKLRDVNYPKNWKTVKNGSTHGPFYMCESFKEIIIPSGVEAIPAYAFNDAGWLYNVVYETTVLTTIGDHAFQDCSNMPQLMMPDTVTSVGKYAYSGCEGLVRIHLSSQLKELAERVFSGCILLEKVEAGDLPVGLVSIGNYAFANCSQLREIYIPSSVRAIGNYAFSYCKKLISLTLQNGMQSVGSYAFRDCVNLESIVIPASVTKIGSGAFNNCSKLTIYGVSGSAAETAAGKYNYVNFAEISSQTAGVSGYVRTSDGNAVENAVVTLSEANGQGFSATSGSDGSWSVSGLAYGKSVDIACRYPGYTFETKTVTISSRNTVAPVLTGFALYSGAIESDAQNLEFSPAGETKTVTITTNSGWQIVPDAGWLSVSPASGSAGTNTVSVSADENAGMDRLGHLQISAGGEARDIAVVQSASDGFILPYGEITVSPERQISGLTFHASGSWTAASSADWLTVETAEGEAGDAEVLFTVAANTAADSRTATISLTAENGGAAVSVVQSGAVQDKAFSFTFSPADVTVGDEVTFTISHSADTGMLRLIVDDVPYDEFIAAGNETTFTRAFTKAGTRRVAFQKKAAGDWTEICASACITVDKTDDLDPAQLTCPAAGSAGEDLTFHIGEVANADAYTVRLYSPDRELLVNRKYTSAEAAELDYNITLDKSLLVMDGEYHLHVMAAGYGYEQSESSALFTLSPKEYRISFTSPQEKDAFVPGDTVYVNVSQTGGGYMTVKVISPSGEIVGQYPESDYHLTDSGTLLREFHPDDTGLYTVTAAVYPIDAAPENNAALFEKTVHFMVSGPSIPGIHPGKKGGNYTWIEKTDKQAVYVCTNSAADSVLIVENGVPLTDQPVESYEPDGWNRVFTVPLKDQTVGRHAITVYAYDHDKTNDSGRPIYAEKPYVFYCAEKTTNPAYYVYPVSSSVPLYTSPVNGRKVDASVVGGEYVQPLTVTHIAGDWYRVRTLDGAAGFVKAGDVLTDIPAGSRKLVLVSPQNGDVIGGGILRVEWKSGLELPNNPYVTVELKSAATGSIRTENYTGFAGYDFDVSSLAKGAYTLTLKVKDREDTLHSVSAAVQIGVVTNEEAYKEWFGKTVIPAWIEYSQSPGYTANATSVKSSMTDLYHLMFRGYIDQGTHTILTWKNFKEGLDSQTMNEEKLKQERLIVIGNSVKEDIEKGKLTLAADFSNMNDLIRTKQNNDLREQIVKTVFSEAEAAFATAKTAVNLVALSNGITEKVAQDLKDILFKILEFMEEIAKTVVTDFVEAYDEKVLLAAFIDEYKAALSETCDDYIDYLEIAYFGGIGKSSTVPVSAMTPSQESAYVYIQAFRQYKTQLAAMPDGAAYVNNPSAYTGNETVSEAITAMLEYSGLDTDVTALLDNSIDFEDVLLAALPDLLADLTDKVFEYAFDAVCYLLDDEAFLGKYEAWNSIPAKEAREAIQKFLKKLIVITCSDDYKMGVKFDWDGAVREFELTVNRWVGTAAPELIAVLLIEAHFHEFWEPDSFVTYCATNLYNGHNFDDVKPGFIKAVHGAIKDAWKTGTKIGELITNIDLSISIANGRSALVSYSGMYYSGMMEWVDLIQKNLGLLTPYIYSGDYKNNKLADYSVAELERLRAAMISIANLDWENLNNLENMRTILEKNPSWYFTNAETKASDENERTFRLTDFPSYRTIVDEKSTVDRLKKTFLKVPANLEQYLDSLN